MATILRKYPFSILVVLAVVYLSFFKPPQTPLDNVTNFDKIAHICMYFGLSGVLWLEYMRSHRKRFRLLKVILTAGVMPVALSGCIELLQEYCTTYRGGDWLDFAANTIGVTLAGLIAYFLVRPRFFRT